MTQKPNQTAVPDDSNPFSTFFNRLPPASIAFVMLVLVMGILLLLSSGISPTASTRTLIVTDTPITTISATVPAATAPPAAGITPSAIAG